MALTLAGLHTNNKNKPTVQFNSNQVYLYRAFHFRAALHEMQVSSLFWEVTAIFMAEIYIFATLNSGMDFSMI